ncbi:NADH-quinone oxidoreductase subunit NuoH [bacterium]|nr:NADH-quinone oxidoreductase subunit NuoH [bacterium]OIO86210.1 MAG: NADH-quinone oxidoreductase subunit H [Anaerolineae bacterium CG2_30_58_95]PIW20658.1 MAG: NADH-quinone oxidoreductase subunit NuoH [Anaerolineae bacterium CG17_big_fil_post_rev_8_21_14_2_50_57_27]PIX47345.1 MAG: NADH-quinone oxidoreductase subunit NuoH [Anaerolineae bacterium CG_4_8_14_3_um_filter_59_70]PJH74844.1 MAG: NADH-quinone oxidoreductase subunit NuoH [Anaerolineae bacterium CG_4_9_14_0_8_um_filter_58_9]
MNFALVVEWLIKGVVLVLILLGGFAYLTYYERKALARIQVRIGPNRAGPWGLLQPIADAIKLIFKEEPTPARADKLLFILAPIVTLVPALVITAVVPWGPTMTVFGHKLTLYIADINVGVLYIMSVASISVYGIVLAGWSSNNKYAMMGGLRSTAQMVSYEIALSLAFISAILLAGTMRMTDIVEAQKSIWFVLLQPVGTAIFLIATLAEVNRPPFDMPEAEQELTGGYHTEYSGMKFALLFMAEYDKMIAICLIGATLFFGGFREFWFLANTIFSVDRMPWLGPIYIFIKIVILLFGMIWVRATFPRIRYDRLMAFGWKVLLPLSLAVVFITAVGIILAEQVNPLWMWGIPVVSLLVGVFAIAMIDRELRRKDYARR